MSEKFLGSGGYGFVVLIGGHPKIAAKKMARNSTAKVTSFSRECQALQSLRHQNIVQDYGFHQEQEYNVIRMEFCERGSLFEVWNSPTIVYSMKTVLCWAEHLFAALCYLEENGIVHRDIKGQNVLVKQDFVLKLADFGCVRDLARDNNPSSTASMAGTCRYMSPEASGYFCHRVINSLNDLYSVGLVLWEIVERRKVYSNVNDDRSLFHGLWSGQYPLESIDCSQEELQNLVFRCTKVRADERPIIKESYQLVQRLNQELTGYDFQPLIIETQTELIRPIGFDGTNERIPLDISVYSGLWPLSGLKTATATKNVSKAEKDEEVQIKEAQIVDSLLEEQNLEISKKPKRMEYAQITLCNLFFLLIIGDLFYQISNFNLTNHQGSEENIFNPVITENATQLIGLIHLNETVDYDKEIDECLDCMCRASYPCGSNRTTCTKFKACGHYQITRDYYADCRFYEKRPSENVTSAWLRCSHDLNCSKGCVKTFYERYKNNCKSELSTCEKLSRLHSGGPSGCGNERTKSYWEMVKSRCKGLE